MRPLFALFYFILVLGCNQKTQHHSSDNLLQSTNTVHRDYNGDGQVLFVTSNATHYGNSDIETTNNFPEILYAYHEFVKAEIEVDFVSPKGGQVPIGYIHSSDSILQKYLFDAMLMGKLKKTLDPSQTETKQYDAIYYVGGGNAMFGIAENKEIQQIARHIIEKNKGILSAICHGTAGIANIKNSIGNYFIEGKKITGFPDVFEDTTALYYKEFPFSIDKIIGDRGATFSYSKEGWDGHFIMADNIITGQDPTSAHLVARQIIKKISQKKEL